MYNYQIDKIPIVFGNRKQIENITTLVDKMLFLNKESNSINANFKDHVEKRPRIKDVRFEYHYNQLSPSDIEFKKPINTMEATIEKFNIEKEGENLVFKLKYTEKDKTYSVETIVLICKFENEYLRKFLYHCIKNFGKKPKLGNVLKGILNINIPRFEEKESANIKAVEEIMVPFLDEWKRKEEIEREIKEVEDTINQKVYELYNLTESEIKIIEEAR